MVWPTGISSSSWARIPPRTPSPGASTSTTALSVSTSISGSPRWTSSPSSLSHRTSRPVSWDIPSAGMTTLWATGGLPLLAELEREFRDAPGRRDRQVLQRGRERNWDIQGADSLDGRVEVVEGPVGDHRRQLGGHAVALVALVDDDRTTRLDDRPNQRLLVQGDGGPRVDDLRRDPLLAQDVGRRQRPVHH